MAIPAEILRQVRRIEITTNRIVNEMVGGRYASVFKGQGIEWAEVREYTPGDEIRTIDWNVTARTGTPHVKRFVEERELTVMFLVDLSGSTAFGSAGTLKHRVATELCAVLALSAIKNRDNVGLLLFTDRVELYLPPKQGSTHVLRLIREVLSFQPVGRGTDVRVALEYLARVMRRRAVVFLLSDFFCGDIRRPLAVANQRYDLISVRLVDPREETLPHVGWLRLEDLETGQEVLLDSAKAAVRQGYEQWAAAQRARVLELVRAAGVDLVDVRTDRPYLDPLLRFFRMRSRRR